MNGAALWASDADTRAELIRRLQAGMATRGFSQAALAASAGLAKATISNALNLAHGSPSAHTLNQLAEALGITGAALAALHRLRERADSRTRRLDAYLVAAARAADEHPYPGVVPGTTPPLAEVYLRQVVTVHEGSAFSVPAEQVLGRDRMCVRIEHQYWLPLVPAPRAQHSPPPATHALQDVSPWPAAGLPSSARTRHGRTQRPLG